MDLRRSLIAMVGCMLLGMALPTVAAYLVGVTLFAILVTIVFGFWPIGLWAIWMDLLVIWRHRENIKRLLSGTERKITDKEKK